MVRFLGGVPLCIGRARSESHTNLAPRRAGHAPNFCLTLTRLDVDRHWLKMALRGAERPLRLVPPPGEPMAEPVRAHDELAAVARRAAEGDAKAIRTLLSAVLPHMLRVVRRVLGAGHPEAEDVVQDRAAQSPCQRHDRVHQSRALRRIACLLSRTTGGFSARSERRTDTRRSRCRSRPCRSRHSRRRTGSQSTQSPTRRRSTGCPGTRSDR